MDKNGELKKLNDEYGKISRTKVSIITLGSTSSGKTSVINCLLSNLLHLQVDTEILPSEPQQNTRFPISIQNNKDENDTNIHLY